GAVVLTVGELWTSAAAWSLSFELADSRAPGQYQGAFALGMSVDSVAGPLLATGLVLGLGIVGWFAAGAVFLFLGTAVARATPRAPLTPPAPAGPAGLAPTLRFAVVDPTMRIDATMRLAYPEAATDLLSVPVFANR